MGQTNDNNSNDAVVYGIIIGPSKLTKGQIRYCNLNKFEDAENSISIGKNRPVIIYQDEPFNNGDYSICVIPLSSSKMYSCDNGELFAINLHDPILGDHVSYIGNNRPVFVAKERIGHYIGQCPNELLDKLDDQFINRLALKRSREKGE